LTGPVGRDKNERVIALLLALALAPRERAEHHLYLANGYFLAGDPLAARKEAVAARTVDPSARLRCDGVRVPVRAAGVRIEICGLDRATPPDTVLREIRRALGRGDRATALRLDPFLDEREGFMRVHAAPTAQILATAD
jgi:hypothetical protein